MYDCSVVAALRCTFADRPCRLVHTFDVYPRLIPRQGWLCAACSVGTFSLFEGALETSLCLYLEGGGLAQNTLWLGRKGWEERQRSQWVMVQGYFQERLLVCGKAHVDLFPFFPLHRLIKIWGLLHGT